jgi:hypothetical protein
VARNYLSYEVCGGVMSRIAGDKGDFLGSLTSELDDNGSHPVVSAVEHAVAGILNRRRTGELTDVEVMARLWALTLTTPEGINFAFGASTGQWYVRMPRSTSWSLTSRPDSTVPLSLPAGSFEWATRRSR